MTTFFAAFAAFAAFIPFHTGGAMVFTCIF
jgi:hypothetical protein